jgi:glyoxylate carboligase
VIQKPDVVQNQQTSLNCQPGVILPSASYNSPSTRVQQQIVQQLSNGQIIRRPLIVGGGGVQNMMLQQPRVSSSNSATLLSTPSFGTQFIS